MERTILKSSKPQKVKLELKGLRISAGYGKLADFIDAINQYLETHKVDYRISKRSYQSFERGITTHVSIEMVYYVSKFLQCPIDIFVKEKV